MRVRLLIFVALVILAALVTASRRQADEAAPADAAKTGTEKPKKARIPFTISKETTYIVRPLRKDGYVDYVAALNEHYSRGVTPQNNAAVLFRQAMGPGEIPEEVRDRFFRLLGIPRLPDKGEYFVSFDAYAEGREDGQQDADREDQLDPALERPWSKKEYPLVGAWLGANQKPLRLLIEATRRPRFYSPLVAEEESVPLIGVSLPLVPEGRQAARALKARAMFHLDAGKVDEAWEDLVACHRLARLAGQGPTLVEELVSIAIDEIACSGDAALAHSGKLTSAQARKCLADLHKLPPMPKIADKLDIGERFVFLDFVASIVREGLAAAGPFVGTKKPTIRNTLNNTIRNTLNKWLTNAMVNWDEVLRKGNAHYDRMVRCARDPISTQRVQVADKLEEEAFMMYARAKEFKLTAMDLIRGKRRRRVATEQMRAIVLALVAPSTRELLKAEERAATQLRLTHVAFALGGYQHDHSAYPLNLSKLAPTYIDELPKDRFTDEPFRYKRQGQGYLLYSVGPNGKDDGGRNARRDPAAEDDPEYQRDDIAIRTPPHKR